MDGQKVMHMSPPCSSTGVLKKCPDQQQGSDKFPMLHQEVQLDGQMDGDTKPFRLRQMLMWEVIMHSVNNWTKEHVKPIVSFECYK